MPDPEALEEEDDEALLLDVVAIEPPAPPAASPPVPPPPAPLGVSDVARAAEPRRQRASSAVRYDQVRVEESP